MEDRESKILINVSLVDSMGDDKSVVNAARVSFNKEISVLSERDEKLIKYLAEHGHWTPFAHVSYSVRITAPFYIARQWFKHTVGIVRNEVSRRYVSEIPEFAHIPRLRGKSEVKKQGSSDNIEKGLDKELREDINYSNNKSIELYDKLINSGVCPEQARMVLPLNTMTEWIESGSLYAASRIYKLRNHNDAQQETKALARFLGTHMENIAPISWKYLTG